MSSTFLFDPTHPCALPSPLRLSEFQAFSKLSSWNALEDLKKSVTAC
jgi:hypothetical protein